MSRIIDISQADADRFSLGTVHARHRFEQSGLFSDDALAELIDGYPAEHFEINTSIDHADGSQEWRHGTIGARTGSEVLEAVRNGKLWINLQHLETVAPRYHALVKRAFAEIEDRNPRFRAMRHNTGLLISSPQARVLYHCDIPVIALWHIRGRKRLWLYPDTEELLPMTEREKVVLRETEEEIPYRKEFDAQAQVFDLEPGDALSWKMHTPHRVDNLEGLNVSITTSYFTPAARMLYGVVYANGAMRRLAGINATSIKATGPVAWGKCAIAAAVRMSGVLKPNERVYETTFEVDPSRALGYAPIADSKA